GRLLNLHDRECIGVAALRRPPARHLTGLRLAGRRAARAGMTVINPVSGQTLGTVTSGAFSPCLGVAVALAYLVGTTPPAPATPVRVTDPAAGTSLDATVAPLPFYHQSTATQ
ncbi:MAG: glycine cleavage T C-terminal barrel domain-containing protein, partial [bacterium]